ncbi:hypothetical protein Tco_1238104 [Tanacetum coccineum]
MTENELHDFHKINSEVFESASDSSVNEIEKENNQVNDRFKKVEGYHAVPPPYTGNYMPSRPDLSFTGLNDYVYKTNVSETITSVPRNESTASKSSKDNLEQPKDVRPSAPIVEEITGQREVRPVWNNAQRVNYQNKLTHPHPKRNFVPTAVLTKSGNVLVNTAKQSSSRAALSNSTTRYVNTVASRPTMNGAKPCSNVFHKSHSSVKRTIYQRTAPKISNLQYALQDQGIFDSGCSRHMTGNKSHLTDYQDIDGGFVAFAGSPKGGKIRTGKLDFDDVYFVKELCHTPKRGLGGIRVRGRDVIIF